MREIKVLGISASMRNGNSCYYLQRGLESISELPYPVSVEIETLRGKKIGPCIGCSKCREGEYRCIIKDSFQDLFLKWLEADVVIYSTPVYHLSIPGQLKCFLDRLGQSATGYCHVRSARQLKVIGTLVQGAHLAGGEEFAALNILQHSVLMNCIPVSGDGWESYTCAAGWTRNMGENDAMKQLAENGDFDTEVALRAAQSLVRRAVETAAIVQCGGRAMKEQLSGDPKYRPFLQRIAE